MNELAVSTSVVDIMTMADVIVKSGLFPQFRSRESAAALMLLCRAKGLDPMTAVERYHIVQGRPVMRADAMLGEFVRMGGTVKWIRRDDQEATATFSHPQGGSVNVTWTIEMAKKAKLTGKDVWAQYPRQMLHARCVSEGVRSVLPGATNGLYTPEEAMNMEPVAEIPKPMEHASLRAISRDSGPTTVLPPATVVYTAEPKVDPVAHKAAVLIAMRDFAEVAMEREYDIAGANGKPSKSKMVVLAKKIVREFDAENIEHWVLATQMLEVENGDGDPLKLCEASDGDGLVLEAEVVARDADTANHDAVGDGYDPFGDD